MFSTAPGYAILPLRILLALVIFPHGAQKLLGWFNGLGFEGSMQYFTETVGLPWIIGLFVILIEFFGPIFILAGFATRVWGVLIVVLMTGIILTNFTDYFFMNWFGNQPSEGFEFFLLAIGMALSLAIYGGGRLSFDSIISNKLR